ncbi:MAG TPA: dolichyl-phosphate beta-glucosyltransferase [Gemmatimonadaceae bacterium]|nr:dolichyl-phosphate beta-glucosyltransferase [Gemmatimonadaceae bacterium]
MDISVVIPAFNEELRLRPTVEEAVQYFRARRSAFEIIVVDDGSRDGTSRLVSEMELVIPELRLIRLAANRGKGYAVRTGILNSRGERVLIADADGSTPMAEVERLEEALDGGAAVAIGSRALSSTETEVKAKLYRRLIGRTFHLWVNVFAVRGIRDTQCGFKLFSGAAAHDLFSRVRMNGFSFDVEVLLNAQRREYRIAEIPVNWEHRPGSRVNLLMDSLRMARDVVIIRSHAMRRHYDQSHVAALPLAAATRNHEPVRMTAVSTGRF